MRKTVLIPGSGVDLNKFKYIKHHSNKPIVLFPARLLSTKGIYEFVSCAKKLKNQAQFAIVGKHDLDARNCIKKYELEKWIRDGIIEYWGESSNMPFEYSKASIVVLPSYRERDAKKSFRSGGLWESSNYNYCALFAEDTIVQGLQDY